VVAAGVIGGAVVCAGAVSVCNGVDGSNVVGGTVVGEAVVGTAVEIS